MEELIRRMKLIIDDANVIINHFENGKSMDDDTIHGMTIYSHIENISIALDLSNEESNEWEFYNK
jgi:hypothetical protein